MSGRSNPLLPSSAFSRLPSAAQEALTTVRRKIDGFLGSTVPVKFADGFPIRIETRVAPFRADLNQGDIDRFSFNHETNQINIAGGVGTARADAVLSGKIELPNPDDLGVDFYVDDIAVSLKGPLINGSTGLDILVTDEMVAGLANSVLKDMRANKATKKIVVDTLNLTLAQRNILYSSIKEGLATMENVGKTILYLE